MSKKKSKKKRYYVTYNRTQISVPVNPRKGKCVACKRKKGEGITVTQIHHTIYEFLLKTIKKNHMLALKNILELCFPCHKIADGFRMLLVRTAYDRILQVFKKLPRNQQTKMVRVCDMILEYWESERFK